MKIKKTNGARGVGGLWDAAAYFLLPARLEKVGLWRESLLAKSRQPPLYTPPYTLISSLFF